MNSTAAIIIKNLILLSIVVITIMSYVSHTLNVIQLQITQWILGALYILFTFMELSNRNFINNLPPERFPYYPGSFFMFRIIKTGVFLMFGCVLLGVPSVIKILAPLCFIIALNEIMVLLLKYSKRLSFVSLGENFVLIGRENIEKIFVSELENVEYRHDILYFVKKNKKTTVVKVFSIKEHDIFLKKVRNWITSNNIKISEESLQRLSRI